MSDEGLQQDRFSQMAAQALKRNSIARRLRQRMVDLLPDWLRRRMRRLKAIGMNPNPIPEILNRFAQNSHDVFFVQIGSDDGVTGDPIHSHVVQNSWKGVVVEPMPSNFARLVETYRSQRGVIPVEAAISTVAEHQPFYCIDSEASGLPGWANQIGSFDRDHVLKHGVLIPNIEVMLVEKSLECITLSQLIDRYQIERIDLLHTDVEGFDFEVIRQLDFARFQPTIILYEDFHLSDAARNDCRELLLAHGYKLEDGKKDCIAYQPKHIKPQEMGAHEDRSPQPDRMDWRESSIIV